MTNINLLVMQEANENDPFHGAKVMYRTLRRQYKSLNKPADQVNPADRQRRALIHTKGIITGNKNMDRDSLDRASKHYGNWGLSGSGPIKSMALSTLSDIQKKREEDAEKAKQAQG